MPPPAADTTPACTECGARTDRLFSNRPLHKGQEKTLLICTGCAMRAELDVHRDAERTVRCAWCGGSSYGASTDSGREICQNCISFCLLAER